MNASVFRDSFVVTRPLRRIIFLAAGLCLSGICSAFAQTNGNASVPGIAEQLTAAEKVCSEDACFTKSISYQGENLPLRGVGLFTYLLFDVYSGAFYAPSDVDTVSEALAEVPKYLVLQYHRKLSQEDFIKSTGQMVKKNQQVSYDRVQNGLEQLYQMYSDVSDGDRYALSYIPSQGTTLYLNNRKVGTIPGEEFQRAVFGIWLSHYSVSKRFTSALISGQI